MREYEIEKKTKSREILTFVEKNAKGEKIQIEIILCENPGGKNALPMLWKKAGFIDRILETYWSIDVFVTEENGTCWGRYNPMSKPSDDGKRNVINFSWMLEATPENKEKLIAEVERLAFTA